MATHALKGEGPPTEIPPNEHAHYTDTLNGQQYLSVGTSSVNDWKRVTDQDGGGNGLPVGGNTDDLLTKLSGADSDSGWRPLNNQPDYQSLEGRVTTNETDIANKIDEPSTKENRQSLVWQETPGEWRADHRIKWRGEWNAGETPYFTSEMVRDNEWTMIVNENVASTTDRAGPTEDGEPNYIIEDAPTWNPQTDSPLSSTGLILDVTDNCRISEIRMWRPSDDEELEYFFTARDITDISDPKVLFNEKVDTGPIGWVPFDVEDSIFLTGTLLEIELVTVATAADVEFDRQWLFVTATSGDPGPRNWRGDGGSNQNIAINKQDWALQDATADLLSMKPGSEFRIKEAADATRFIDYQVQEPIDQGAYVEYVVEVITEGQSIRSNQLCDVKGISRGIGTSPLVELPGYFTGNSTFWNGSIAAQGFRRADLTEPIVQTDNAYGVDVQGVRLEKSDDWDIVAASVTTVGGGGGADRFTDLVDTPSSYVGEARKTLKVSDNETSIVFDDASINANRVFYVDAVHGDDTIEAERGNIDKPFKTIKAAFDEAALQVPPPGPANDFAIRVNPGTYNEDPIFMTAYTGVFGIDQVKARVIPNDPDQPLFTMQILSNINNLNIIAPANNAAVDVPFAAGSNITNCLISDGQIGINVQAGLAASIDLFLENLNLGQLGTLQTALNISGGAKVNGIGIYAESQDTLIFNISNGAELDITGGLLSNAAEGVTVDGGRVKIGDFKFLNCPQGIDATNGATVEISNTRFTAGGAGTPPAVIGINGTGSTTIIDCDTCSFEGYNAGINVTDCDVTVSDSNFEMPDVGGTFALRALGSATCQIKDCFFRVADLTQFPTGIDTSGTTQAFIDDCIFVNFRFGVIAKENSIIKGSDCICELEDGIDRTGTGGLVCVDSSNVDYDDSDFNVESGAICQDTAKLFISNVNFEGSTNEFQQVGQGEITLNNCRINEDNLVVENWDFLNGTWLSSKVGDTALQVIDKLKVGEPEQGQISSFGGGANFTRGLLCYTFNSDNDSFQDRTNDAKDVGGVQITFPSTSPNSAIYLSHTLVDVNKDPFPFSGFWLNVTDFGDVGNGEIVSEIWTGSSWQEIQDMLSQAEPPFNQIPRGDSVNIPEGRYNMRFDDRVEQLWESSDPVGLGFDSYWYRMRIKGNWFNLAWGYRIKFTAQATAISGVHTDIPLMLDLSALDPTFWTNVLANGHDIRVTDATGTNQLAVEISTFDSGAQTGRIYFKSGFLSNAVNTDYYIYYGNPDAVLPLPTSEFGDANVWNDYQAVYHFNDPASDGQTVIDSSKVPKIINGTIEGGSIGSASDGILDNYYTFASVDTDSINIGTDPEVVAPGLPLTVQCIFQDTTGNEKRRLFSIASDLTGPNDEDNVGLYIETSLLKGSFTSSNIINSGINVSNGQWRSCHLTTDGNIGGLYVDGALANTTVGIGGLTPSSFPGRIGNRGSLAGSFSFGGSIDEVRISNQLFLPERVTTETTNIFFQNLFFTFTPEETREEATAGGGGDPIVQSMEIDQMKLHPLGFQEISQDGYTQWFGSARPIMPLQIGLGSFDNTPATGNPPQTGTELWITQSSGQIGNYYFPQDQRTTITALKRIRTELDTSSPIRFQIYFAGLSANAGDILWRAVVSFSDPDTVLWPTAGQAPQSVAKQSEALALVEVEAGRLGQTEFVVLEVILPDVDTSQTYDERSDLAWVTIERVGDSVLDDYDNTVKILTINVDGTIWRNGSHIAILGDAPPVGLPGTFPTLRGNDEIKTRKIKQAVFKTSTSSAQALSRRMEARRSEGD